MQTMKSKSNPDTPSADSSGARRASEESAANLTPPNPEVCAQPPRRRFTASYKRTIVERAETCQNNGEVGALLRQEGLYSSHLSNWRRLYREGALQSLNAQKRGPKTSPDAAKLREITVLEKKVAKLERELEKAHTIIDVQKKLSIMLSALPKPEES